MNIVNYIHIQPCKEDMHAKKINTSNNLYFQYQKNNSVNIAVGISKFTLGAIIVHCKYNHDYNYMG